MKYERVLAYVAETPWAILPAKFHEVLSFLAYRAAGHEFTAAEIRARIGEPSSRLQAAACGHDRPRFRRTAALDEPDRDLARPYIATRLFFDAGDLSLLSMQNEAYIIRMPHSVPVWQAKRAYPLLCPSALH